jgi:hypothetical protein
VSGVPWTEADLNAAALPNVSLDGVIGASDFPPGSINSSNIVPGPIAYALTTGSANAYLAAPNPSLVALAAGAWLAIKVSFTNTGPSTINVNGTGPKALLKQANLPLRAGDLIAGQMAWLQYDGVAWQLTSYPGGPRKLYAVGDGGSNAYMVDIPGFVPAINADLVGIELAFRASFSNTGPSTLAVHMMAAAPIKKPNGSDLATGDIVANAIVVVRFDGTNFQMVGASSGVATLPDIVAGGIFTSPSSVTIDTKGRVTAITAGTGAVGYSSPTPSFVPAIGGFLEESHGLLTIPKSVQWRLVCFTPDLGYAAGQEVNVEEFFSDASLNSARFGTYCDATHVGITRNNLMNVLFGQNRLTRAAEAIVDETFWRVRCHAVK